jgi:hypothetical protein
VYWALVASSTVMCEPSPPVARSPWRMSSASTAPAVKLLLLHPLQLDGSVWSNDLRSDTYRRPLFEPDVAAEVIEQAWPDPNSARL